MINHLSEIDLDLLVQGDHRQWENFVRQVSPVVFSVIKKTLVAAGRGEGEAHDILQEMFAKLCAGNFLLLKKYNPQKAKLTTWLAVIARNMAIDYLRRCRSQYCSMDEISAKGARNEDASLDADKIMLSFDLLPARQMMVMKLIYEKDMDVKEVARFMGITEQSVRSMRHKAVVKLRHMFEQK